MKSHDLLKRILKNVISKECWKIDAGISTGSWIIMHFGNKIPKKEIFKRDDPNDPFYGEWALSITCSWRLDQDDATYPITSSQEKADELAEKLKKNLIGKRIIAIKVTPPAWDLKISFEDRYHLSLFCDLSMASVGDNSTDNWNLWTPEFEFLSAGPGYRVEYPEGTVIQE